MQHQMVATVAFQAIDTSSPQTGGRTEDCRAVEETVKTGGGGGEVMCPPSSNAFTANNRDDKWWLLLHVHASTDLDL